MYGYCIIIKKWIVRIIINPKISLIVKYRWNGIFIFYFYLFLKDYLIRSNVEKNKCITTNAIIINGKIKWNE